MDSLWLLVGITALAGVGGTGMGGVIACLFRKDSDKTVSLLLSFAAGVMTSVVCFDLACPNCYEEASITRDLTLLENQRAKCGRCGRLYDLNNQGIIVDGEQGTSLYRYRIQYYPSGNNMTVNN